MVNNTLEKNLIKKEKISFANGLNFYKLFWIFFIGCFAGVVIEMIWCLLKNGVIQSRTALVLEPLNPVYGIGAVLISICFIRFKNKNNILIFLGSMIVGGIFESVCSLFQELAFGTVSWNYGPESLGIFGRTSLIYCIFWGILGVVWVRIIYPLLSKIIEKIPNNVGKVLTYILLIIVLFDIMVSTFAVYRQSQRRISVPANSKIDTFFDTHYNDNILKEIYPNMIIVK
ncbi:MAG: putative ABC transporter permease [Clostridia bacterium]